MATPKQVAAIELYAGIMEEVKLRTTSIEQALGTKTGIAPPFRREFCFLQMRMICELIALGCLTAHGDIAPKKLHKEWSADKILTRLSELHPDFYPHPVTHERPKPGFVVVTEIKSGFLTKDELIKLYGTCGDVLHRGSAKKLIKPRIPAQTQFPDIGKWMEKIAALLRLHLIYLHDHATNFICVMSNSAANGGVQVSISEALDGPAEAAKK